MSPSRQVSRRAVRRHHLELTSLDRATGTEIARIQALESLEIARHEALNTATTVALSGIAHVGMAEAWFAASAPHTAQRLALVADEHAWATAQRVQRLAREL
jgi:hypothetical protein